MSAPDDQACTHEWGPPEEVELGIGTVFSPLCTHCGAVKLQLGEQAWRRQRVEIAMRPINQERAS
jgi:hypothetical protein